jgi:non-canonical (house-cleaning) NTP pyrophosphatase
MATLSAKIDPELTRQLQRARSSGQPVHAVVSVRRTPGRPPQPDKIEALVKDALDRTSAATGQRPADYHVLGRMATAYVSAPAQFISILVDQPEIVGAVANGGSAVAS